MANEMHLFEEAEVTAGCRKECCSQKLTAEDLFSHMSEPTLVLTSQAVTWEDVTRTDEMGWEALAESLNSNSEECCVVYHQSFTAHVDYDVPKPFSYTPEINR